MLMIQELRGAIDQLMGIARGLKARRVKGGALELESVEVQVQLSETKSIENLNPKQHLEIHDTIAECMIFANHWVAKKIAEVFLNQALLRHHPLSKEEQFANLHHYAISRGFEVQTSTNKILASSLDQSWGCLLTVRCPMRPTSVQGSWPMTSSSITAWLWTCTRISHLQSGDMPISLYIASYLQWWPGMVTH
ncbi:DIS3-like exonuclease 1 isoform X2 [Dreissena polymorpha]|uniref:DIS3-like exonuclease 1 n=1 Tax=Dreissena polymorpha TaxID=45954 RepID=A0A9D4J1S2_DREPO|nr:DIS3-like exonuclease 1 isoform X2 [Dreissena polymorpha]XP_052223183.1 DIS3-like exonuclease 1 isoform X2 [Dreissena polymorpha]XP_052223184.1 DIS3-like exonuclease 1 isoform X2 [Dreissena polymorpha]KAH3795140.1 hypothetical protein DPMN_148687 [Dreissena polymorpha]